MMKVIDLRVENQTEPFALGVRLPRFSWRMISDQCSVCQTAYRVAVRRDGEIVFDTQRVDEDTCIGIEYAGQPLLPLTTYTVDVEIWDNCGQHDHASTQFTTSRFDMPWQASWVEPEQESAVPQPPAPRGPSKIVEGPKDYSGFRPAQYMRQEFQVKGRLKRALAFASAHGIYRLYINGKRADLREFAPEATTYETFLQYQTYDLTDLIDSGTNAIGAILADGWWVGRIGLAGTACQYGDKTAFLMELRLEYEDGSVETILSDDFKSATGPIIYSDLFAGERYDARAELRDWAEVGYNDTAWKRVLLLDEGYGNLMPQLADPVLPECEFAPERIIITPSGDVLVDIGQVIAGRVRFTVEAPEGVEIKLEHVEVLDENGEFFFHLEGMNKEQTDYYITREGLQTYEPMFTYHGFRYVRVTGWPGEITKEMFTAVVLASAGAKTGNFSCSDERLNRLQQNIWWSQLSNTLAIPTDCPQRERAGWTGDISIFAPTMAFNRESDVFLTRWLLDCRHSQTANGQIPVVVPYWPCYKKMHAGRGDTSSGWGDAILTVPWALYNAYGDVRVLQENYDAMKRWMDFVETAAQTGLPQGHENFDEKRLARQKYLWNTGFHLGDWLIPSLTGIQGGIMTMMKKTGPVVGSAYYVYDCVLMAKIALKLGDMETYRKYTALSQLVKQAFVEEYVGEDGLLEADYQGIYVICLAFDLVSDDIREKMIAHLIDMIERNHGCLDTGFLSVPFLMDVLTKAGRRDMAFSLLYQTRCPSWLYEVEMGATTLWECWNAVLPDGTPTVTSYNHYAFGCVGDWIYREIAGLKAALPGYKRIRFTPGIDSGLGWAKASHMTPYGETSICWKKKEDGYQLKVIVPANTKADIVFPGESYTRDGMCVLEENGVLKIEGNIISVGSGIYEFEFR